MQFRSGVGPGCLCHSGLEVLAPGTAWVVRSAVGGMGLALALALADGRVGAGDGRFSRMRCVALLLQCLPRFDCASVPAMRSQIGDMKGITGLLRLLLSKAREYWGIVDTSDGAGTGERLTLLRCWRPHLSQWCFDSLGTPIVWVVHP